MRPLRVLHVVPHLERVGGYERQAALLASRQHERLDCEPILLTHAFPGRPPPADVGECPVHELPRGLLRHHPGPFWRRHGRDIDVVHAHAMHKLSGQVVALAARDGVPSLVKVATEGDVSMFADPDGWTGPLDGDDGAAGNLRWRLMIKVAFARLRRASGFLALSPGIAAELARHDLPSVPVPNGVDAVRFHPPTPAERAAARRQLGLSDDAWCAVFVGRLGERKDVRCLIDAWARLCEDDAGHAAPPDTRTAGEPELPSPPEASRPGGGARRSRLLIVGDGPRRADLEQRAADVGVGSSVDFLGEWDDVRPALHAANVFVLPSRREGLPNAVLEALASGCPTVLSDIEAHRALLTDPSAAELFEAGDAVGLARVLQELREDPGRTNELGQRARSLADGTYAIDRIADRLQELYVRLSPGRR